MNIEFEWTRNDLKEALKKKRMISNIVFIILSILLYFYITFYGFVYNEFDNLKLIIGFIIYIAIILVIIYLINLLYINIRLKRNDKRTNKAYGKYIIKLDDEKILSKFNNQTISYKWNKISKFKIRKNYFFIRTNDDYIGLKFYKTKLGKDYDSILNYVSKKISNQ